MKVIPVNFRKRLAVAASALLCAPLVAPATLAMPPEAGAQSAELWGIESNRVGTDDIVAVSISEVTPQVPSLGASLTIRLQVRNTSDHEVSNIVVRTQRAAALASAAQARTSLAEPESVYDVVGNFSDPIDLKPGEARDITLTAPISDAAPQGLGITEPGTYPLLINVNGRPYNDIDKLLKETRALLPVSDPDAAGKSGNRADVPAAPAAPENTTPGSPAPENAAPGDPNAQRHPVPMSVIWPISQAVPLVGGETGDAPAAPELILANDSLADSLRPGGHLDGLVSSLEKGFAGRGGEELQASTCIAIDPETLDAVSRMTRDYWVGTQRPSPVQASQRLRDSWGGNTDSDLRKVSANSDAQRWLDRLRHLASGTCVISLPWASTDMSAVAQVGDEDLAMEALAAGRETIHNHLDTDPLPNVHMPTEGFVTSESAPLYARATAQSPLSTDAAFEKRLQEGSKEAVKGASPEGGATSTTPATPTAPATPVEAFTLVANNTVTKADGTPLAPGESGILPGGVRSFALPGALSSALAATGSDPQTTAYSNIVGRHDFRADSGAARMQTAVGTLYQELSDAARTREPGAIVAAPPAGWSPMPEEAARWIDAVRGVIDSSLADGVALRDALNLSTSRSDAGPVQPNEPSADPAPVRDADVEKARMASQEMSDLTVIMANDPFLALTRYGFTRPLRRDILRSLTSLGRRSIALSSEVQKRDDDLREAALTMTRRLRNSVALVAPGGVYTRATDLSPVVVLARNGLPLPVPAFVRVAAGDVVMEDKYEASIPAKGSVTVQLAPGAKTDNSGGDNEAASAARKAHYLTLWLESPRGTPISQSVAISVQSGVSVGILLVATVAVVAVGGFLAAKRSRSFRKNASF
nr:hypothetical protein [Corynebacterium lactis]